MRHATIAFVHFLIAMVVCCCDKRPNSKSQWANGYQLGWEQGIHESHGGSTDFTDGYDTGRRWAKEMNGPKD